MKKLKCIITCLFLIATTGLFSMDFDFGSPLSDDYVISSPFGYRKSVMGGLEDGLHRGADLVPISITKDKKAEVKILAVEDATVYVVFGPPGSFDKNGNKLHGHPLFGGMVILYHGDGWYSLYGHMKETWVRTGQRVKKGQPIGLVGSTGQSTGPHLHFELDRDPMCFLAKSMVHLDSYPNFYTKDLNIKIK
jgi:murein DD-endopeptidase MepM/ murein hydrolase activator NlpD